MKHLLRRTPVLQDLKQQFKNLTWLINRLKKC